MAECTSFPIAIIGLGCRLPGGVSDTEALWDLLAKGTNTWSPVPSQRFNEDAFYHPDPRNNGTTNHRGGHFLSQDNEIAAFDAGFFGLSAPEAHATDPQQRLLLEVSYEAFENAGIPIEQIQGSDTAVYAAMFTRDYDRNTYKDPIEIPKYHTTGCGEAILANRISYFFHLNGPSMTLDTGCSGSMVALHQACQSLRTGESSAALACGVSLILNPDHMIGMSNLYMLNDDGRSYPFDARGAGYGRGEGVTAVVLKRLDDALNAGDSIRAVIRNTSINHDGKTNGITLPSSQAQEALQRKTYQQATLDPCTVQYMEAHGTGTAAGDLAELQAIAHSFCKNRPPSNPLYVGSVKSNIGHLESASGLAGLIKTVLMLERGYLLPNADFHKPKPELTLDEWKMRIPQKLEPLPSLQRACVNSFGYGGVNAHAILECSPSQTLSRSCDHQALDGEAGVDGMKSLENGPSRNSNPEATPRVHDSDLVFCRSCQHDDEQLEVQTPMDEFGNIPDKDLASRQTLECNTQQLFVITGDTHQKVLQTARKLRRWTSAQSEVGIDLDSLAYTLGTRRSMHRWRHVFQASSREELLFLLNKRLVATKSSKSLRTIFIFTGQGAQWHAMGRELNSKYSIYRDSIRRSDEILRDLGAPWGLIRELGRGEKDSRIHQSEIAQPSSTALQIALVDLLVSFGVRPATVIGHSSGEIAAAYAAGTISHRTALKVSFGRSLLSMACKLKIPSKGAMLAVGLGESQVSPLLLQTRKGALSLACVNSSVSTTVSGDESAIFDLQDRLNALGVFNRKLNVDTAYHSHHMREVAHDYLCSLGDVDTNAINDQVTYISSVTGAQKNQGFGSNYWVQNLISKVCFSDALKQYCNLEYKSSRSKGVQHLIIEIGPHGALAGPVQRTMAEAAESLVHTYIPVLTRGRDAVQSIMSLSGRLIEHGYPMDVQRVNCLLKPSSRLRVLSNLPTYPWDHSTAYWHESRLSRDYRMRQHPSHDLLGIKITGSTSLEPSWRYVLSLDSLPWLADHVIEGLITFPGTGYVCMAIEASKQLAQDKGFNPQSFLLQSVSFVKALVIPPAPKTMELQLCFRPQQHGQTLWDEFRVYALSENDIWHEHCRGRILANPASSPRTEDPQSSKSEAPEMHLAGSRKMSANDVYSRLRANGNSYGPCFACIKELQIANSQAVGYVAIPDIRSTMPAGYQQEHVIHPTTLDALLHTAVPLFEHHCGSGSVMPIFIEELTIFSDIISTPGESLIVTVEIHPKGERSALADISVSGDEKVATEQSSLMISGVQLLGVGDLERSRFMTTERHDMAYQLQWIPEITRKAQNGLETNLNSRTEARYLPETPTPDSLRATSSLSDGDCQAGKESEQVGVQIHLIVANRCRELAAVITSLLYEKNHQVIPVTWASRAESAQTIYIVLDDSEQPFLESPTEALFQHIIKTIESASNILWVSTQVGKVDTSSGRDPKSALMTGFARATHAEYEQLIFTTLDIPDDIGKELPSVSRAVAEIFRRSLNGCQEMEYVYRESRLLIPRLVPDHHINKMLAQAGGPQLEEVLYLRSNDRLGLDSDSLRRSDGLYFVDDSTALGSLKPDEVEVVALAQSFDLRRTVLNNRRTTEHKPIISDFAGTICAIGSKAQTKVKIGDAVIGWNVHGLAYVNRPRTVVCNVTRIPSHWSFPIAAAMAVPLMAAYYSLIEIAKLREGQSILIYGTATLYGQVSIAMAKSTGAKVFATVSTMAQQAEFVTRFNLPPSRFLSDRDMRLKREVLRLTAERGVDVVLQMPSDGPAPELGDCVAGLGVYVQVLRAAENTHFVSPIFTRPAITFASFDVDTIAQHRPEKLAHSLEKAVSMLSDEFAPIGNVKCIAMSQIEDAIVEARRSKAPEKIILTADAITKVRVRRNIEEYSQNLRSDATYVIAGGLGDLGQKVSISMAKYGAKYLVLLSRRSPTPAEVDSLQESLQQYSPGLKLHAIGCDISKLTAVLDVSRKLESLMLPAVRGLFQSAAVLQDRVLEQMTAEDWQLPLQTKMHGTRNLDEVFRSSSLDFFVMLSSMSGVIGTRGQANYAAGNTYQDAFAQGRVDSQTAYIALDLGMIDHSAAYEDQVGQVRIRNLLRQGLIPIKSAQLNAILEWVLSPDAWRRRPGQFAIGIDGASIHEAENATPTSKNAMFTHVRGAHETKAPAVNAMSLGHKSSIMAADTLEEVKVIISEATRLKVLSLIPVDRADVDQNSSLQDLGLDSLMAIEVKNFICKEFDATVHASEILDEPCLAELSTKIASRSETLRKKFGDLSKAKKSNGESPGQDTLPEVSANEIPYPSAEGKLPTLPLPKIEDTMDLYLASANAFLDSTEFERTSDAIRVFKGKSGRVLQEKLESRREALGIDNWQYDLTVSGVYLRRRMPIHPFGTFYGVHLLTKQPHSQAERAAIIAEAAYAFQRKLEANELDADYLNGERLCAQSLKWLFNACREPLRNVDKTRKHERNKYLIILRRGHVFKVALEQESQPVTLAKLRKALNEIMDLSSQTLPSIATLTADDRDSWADLRGDLLSMNTTNHNTLVTIEAAAFVICLDDSSPATPTDRCNSLLLGDPRNRWSDKTLQFVVCANGVSGYVCEHSMLDAASLRQLNESITNAIIESTVEPNLSGIVDGNPTILEELTFYINNALLDNIDRVHKLATVTFKPAEFTHFKLPSMGNMFLRNRRIPSKSGIQIVIQLASLLYYGVQYPSWETLTMMLFRGGRLDWIQSVSPAMFKFCETAFMEDITLTQRSKLLHEAAVTHTSTMTRISRGRGFAAHLEALREVAHQEEALPELFTDPTWEMMRVISPRKLKTDASGGLRAQEAGFFMPDPESVFVHYEIDEAECRFFVQSTEGRTERFCDALEKAAEQVCRLLEEP